MNIEIDYKALRIKYINLMSDINCKYNKTELCKILDISRPTLYKFLRENNDLENIIHENLKAQRYAVGNMFLRRLIELCEKTKNPKLIEMGLSIGELYCNKEIILNQYDNMKDDDLNKKLGNLLNRAKNKRDVKDV